MGRIRRAVFYKDLGFLYAGRVGAALKPLDMQEYLRGLAGPICGADLDICGADLKIGDLQEYGTDMRA